jgi:hypothetical protein
LGSQLNGAERGLRDRASALKSSAKSILFGIRIGSPGFKVQNQIHSKQRFMIFFAGHAALKIRLGTSIASH